MNLPSTLATRLVDYEPDKLVDYSEESDDAAQEDNEENTVIFIGPLTVRVGYEQIYEIFSTFGEVVDVKMVKKGRKGNIFSFVRFDEAENAADAVRAMDGGVIDYQEVIASHVDVDYQDYNANWKTAGGSDAKKRDGKK